MNIILTVIGVFFGLYICVWGYLLWWNRKHQKQATATFLESWKNDTYSIHNSYDYGSEKKILRVKFPSKNGNRHFNISCDGQLESYILWDSVNISKEMKPAKWQRRALEEYTKQLATMHKLKSNGDDDDGIGGMAGGFV